MSAIIEAILAGERRATGAADMVLDTAAWAAASLGRFRRDEVLAILRAASEAGRAAAGGLAEAAVAETGLGIASHQATRNELAAGALSERLSGTDFCSPRAGAAVGSLELPRPAGVVLAPLPAVGAVAAAFAGILEALATRNAIVIAPDERARGVTFAAARCLGEAAERAGAPAGIVQVLDDPAPQLLEHVGRSPLVGVVRAPGAPPGSTPVLVDASADLDAAASHILASRSFDNGLLPGSESVVIAEEAIAGALIAAFERAGGRVAAPAELRRLRDLLFGGGAFDQSLLGRCAVAVAAGARIRLPDATPAILAPLEAIGGEEPLAGAKPCPVLGILTVPHFAAGIAAVRAALRQSGGGAAAIHSQDPDNLLAFAAGVAARRLVVNAPCGPAAAGQPEPAALDGLVRWVPMACGDAAARLSATAWDAARPPLALGREAPISLGRLQEGVAQPPG
jgi:acyl-CoA reductase-like NAD-dependent aldehyde dehydrogenase